MIEDLTEKDMVDLAIVRRIRSGKAVRTVTKDYTIVSQRFYSDFGIWPCDRGVSVAPIMGEAKEFDGLVSRWYECGECGQPIDRGDMYCRRCGRRVKWDER